MKTFSLLLVLFVLILLLGCADKKTHKEKIRDGEVVRDLESSEVNLVKEAVVVGCPIPEYTCDFRGQSFNPTKQLVLCVALQKEIINNCKAHSKELNDKKETK